MPWKLYLKLGRYNFSNNCMYYFQEDPFEDASREWASTDSNNFQKNNNSVKGTQNIFIVFVSTSFCLN